MEETTAIAEQIQTGLLNFVAAQRTQLAPLGEDVERLFDEIIVFITGGKRFRALFTSYGYQSIAQLSAAAPALPPQAVLDAASALELFHAAALIHDDVIDRSATRRGRKAMHMSFSDFHRKAEFRSDPEKFGIASAILIGDLLQSWADALFDSALSQIPAGAAARARAHFNRMRNEVAAGQYLDVLEEQQPHFADHQEQLNRSTRVLIYKSAKYSVEAPLLIGAALAGASAQQESAISGFGLPVGIAFQLRDDLLGVFGDTEVTGKPAGDDLIEGKRTVLMALTRKALPVSQQRIFDDLFGTKLDTTQVSILQRTIKDCGAKDQLESLIEHHLQLARTALNNAELAPKARQALVQLAELAARRSS